MDTERHRGKCLVKMEVETEVMHLYAKGSL